MRPHFVTSDNRPSRKKRRDLTVLLTMAALSMPAQAAAAPVDSLQYSVSGQYSVSHGQHTPLWLNANKYGLSSLRLTNGYLRASLTRDLHVDDGRRFGVGYGVDVAKTLRYTSGVVIQQAFVEGRWLKGVLTVGSKEYPMELKNRTLSTGSQTLGVNARPVPQVRLALPDYWTVPLTRGWVAVKGHIAFGNFTDDKWQKEFTQQKSRFTEDVRYHSKAGYLRVGDTRHASPVSVELGLEMASQFGGVTCSPGADGHIVRIENNSGFRAYWDAFVPGGADITEDVYRNVEGNQVGSWLMRVNLDYPRWYLGVYADHYFEDHSGMFFLDYDGYGNGPEWNEKKKSRYLLYDLRDIMLGVDLRLKNTSAWVDNVVVEYLYTKYQSGPIYHDHSPLLPDHIGGVDSYYNHSIYTGWQHWGQVMGNPLYLSPLYNDDATIRVKNNRFVAWHLGLAGHPGRQWGYRCLATFEKGFGTYQMPYADPRETVSVLAEAHYAFDCRSYLAGWSVKGGWGADFGRLYGDNWGFQLTVTKKGLLTFPRQHGRHRKGER